MKRLYYFYRRIRCTISFWGRAKINGQTAWIDFKTAYKAAKTIWS